MTNTAAPAVLYRLIIADDWKASAAAGYVLYADLDLKDGFLHLSTAAQVLETAVRYFRGRTDLLALEIKAGALGARVRYEPSTGGALFPHLYGALPTSAVARARPLAPAGDGFAFADGKPAA